MHLELVHEAKQNPADFFAFRRALLLTTLLFAHLHRDEICQQVLQKLDKQEVVLRALLLVLLEQLARVLVRVAPVVRPTLSPRPRAATAARSAASSTARPR